MDLGRFGPHAAACAVIALCAGMSGRAAAMPLPPGLTVPVAEAPASPARSSAGAAPEAIASAGDAAAPSSRPAGQPTSPLAPPGAPATVPGAEVLEAEAEVVAAPRRPRFVVSVGLGASLDPNWGGATTTIVSPAFAGTLGFGDGPLGFELRLVSNQASGRSSHAGPDRLGLDFLLAVRPWAAGYPRDGGWGGRFVRTVTINAGLAAQRVGSGPSADWRGGLILGAYVDVPLGGPPGQDGELKFRLAVRRLFAGDAFVGDVRSGDSTELLAGPVVAF